MSNKRMLTEGTVRRFMKLARVDSLSDNFVNEMYSSPMEEDEALQEKGCGTMEEDMMDVSEEDGTLEAGFEGQADADGIEAMQEVDYTSHGDVDEDMMYGEGMFDEDMAEGSYMEEDMMEEEEDKLQGEEIFMAESLQRDPSVAWLFEQAEEDEPIEDEEEEGDEQEDMPIDAEMGDEMGDDMGDPEEDIPMDDAMGEADISLTEEEAELLISLGERLKEAMEEGDAAEPVEDDGDITGEMPVGDEGDEGEEDEDEEEEEPEADQEELIQEILRRVTKRIMNQKLSRK